MRGRDFFVWRQLPLVHLGEIVAFRSEANIFYSECLYSPLVPRLCLGTHCIFGFAIDAQSKTHTSNLYNPRYNSQAVRPKIRP